MRSKNLITGIVYTMGIMISLHFFCTDDPEGLPGSSLLPLTGGILVKILVQ